MPSSLRPFDSVVIVTNNEEHARWDRRSLAVFRPTRVEQFGSGAEALEYFQSTRVDLVLLDSQLDDMEALQLLRLTRRERRIAHIPFIMVSALGKREVVLDAIAAGCAAYILRPYSEETFKKNILRGCQINTLAEVEDQPLEDAKALVASGNFDDAIQAFENIISEQNEAQRYYDMGCRHLINQQFGPAIIAFTKALRINDLFAEAYKGLADAYKGKGDLQRFKLSMQKAATVHAQFNRMEKTKELFIEIIKYDPDTPNPYNTLGVKLRKSGDLPGALHAYAQALALTPDDENIHCNVAKAHYFMGNIEQARVSVLHALDINPNLEEARQLYRKLFNREFPAAAPREG